MKLCIFGSRDFNDYEFLAEIMDKIHVKTPISEVVSGKAKGADTLGEIWAKKNNIKVREFWAEWDKYGKSAGYRRNKLMAEYCDAAIGFSLNQSRGSANMRQQVKSLGKKCVFYEYQ